MFDAGTFDWLREFHDRQSSTWPGVKALRVRKVSNDMWRHSDDDANVSQPNEKYVEKKQAKRCGAVVGRSGSPSSRMPRFAIWRQRHTE